MRGREVERAAIAALIDGAIDGNGAALVLRGQPGVGKSVLLADAAGRAEGVRLLRTQGVESESPLAFAALHRLLRPVWEYVDRLPGPQARALRAAFGEGEGSGGDRFLIFLAALSLLAEVAERAPVVAIVDDAHWLDDASAAALLFVARRLQAERVALIFAAREGDVRQFDSGDLPSLTVGAIDPDAAGALLDDHAGVAVPVAVRDRLLEGTAGNPLALVELADALSADELAGRVPLPAQLPLTAGVERAFLDRYRRLPVPAQQLLLVAAADDSGRVSTVRQAAAALGAGEDALDAGERSGLLRARDGQLELRHPLVRSAVYGAATSAERRRAHRALAEAMAGPEEADRRAWHRAAATEEPDETVVAELDEVARRAGRRGGHEAAAAAWERAAELTVDEAARARRLYAAALSAWTAAQPGRARTLAETAGLHKIDPVLRADIDRLRARIEWNVGTPLVGHRILLQGAQAVAPVDPVRALEMGMLASAVGTFTGDSGTGIDPLDFVGDAAEESAPPRLRCLAHLLYGMRYVSAGDLSQATRELRISFALTESVEASESDLLGNAGVGSTHLGDDEVNLRVHTRLLAAAREHSAVVLILYALTRRAFGELATGRWSALEAGAEEAWNLARGTNQPALGGLPLATLAALAALRGQDDAAARLAAAEQHAAAHPTGITSALIDDVLRWSRSMESAAQPATALHHLEQIASPWLRQVVALDHIEAALRADQAKEAAGTIEDLETFAAATGAAWAAACAEHGRALLADGDEAEQHFRRALEEHARSPRRFHRARTALAYGEFLRRSQRRVDARTHLRSALEIFEDLGAQRWAERARQELRASGETARKRDPSAVVGLTPQELQVARLVGQGMSTRDVATQLFLSPRTVDFHLRNVFAKLGVRSRVELALLPLE